MWGDLATVHANQPRDIGKRRIRRHTPMHGIRGHTWERTLTQAHTRAQDTGTYMGRGTYAGTHPCTRYADTHTSTVVCRLA